ncbi:acetate/propionate family kinase [Catellatospora tritici]|uniref:acetate/propionate family kinase n=1 Tax=Catellatospora tritici TaxID=2851566 RepID=UPI001C2D049E|nr:acetate kinase [Catellatospora tritici]MBV1848946.1 acetate kinase [Catellatospora tritici]
MKILVLNCGSASVKWGLFADGVSVDGGLIDRVTNHAQALRELMFEFDPSGLDAVGHRVVHGGLRFTTPTLLDDHVVEAVTKLVPLAPLHNPLNLLGIQLMRQQLPDVPQVAVFDTAFHRTLGPAQATYAIDIEVAQENGIARYGFHGTSHAYVSRRTAALLGKDPADANVITLHLGNGASACAVRGGLSVATSMGLSPLEGLVMGTRSGDIDPAVVFHLHRHAGMGFDAIEDLLNQRSGLKGLCGDNDMREVLRRRAEGDERAALAFDVYCARVTEYVGAYYALLGRVDAVTFTAGVGENAAPVRAAVLAGLERMGITVDPAHNEASDRGERLISPDGSEVAVCVVPTDEECEIATQTSDLLTRTQ